VEHGDALGELVDPDMDGHVDEVFGLLAGGSQRGDEVACGDVEPPDDSAAANGSVGTLRGLTG
jgi:hypothetical protein